MINEVLKFHLIHKVLASITYFTLGFIFVYRKFFKLVFKTSFWPQDTLMKLWLCVLNSQRLFCSQIIGINSCMKVFWYTSNLLTSYCNPKLSINSYYATGFVWTVLEYLICILLREKIVQIVIHNSKYTELKFSSGK